MANTTIFFSGPQGVIPVRVVDNGDGTYSLAISGAGGSTAVTIADAADVTLGAKADAAATTDTGTFSLIALIKRLLSVKLPAALGQGTMAQSFPIVVASNQSAIPIDSELPAAAALADTTANPTIPSIGGLSLLFNGATWDRGRTPNVFVDVSAVAVGTIATVWTPTSGKKFRLMGGVVSVSAAANVLFEDNAAGAGNFVFRTPKLLVDTPFLFTLGGNGKLSATINNVLKATSSAAANLTGTLWGTEE